MEACTIQIVLWRNNKKDDTIHIARHEVEKSLYSVKYRDKDSGYTYYFEDTWEEVEAYLSQIFAVLPLDQDPFTGVQFSLPAYPSIVVKASQTTDENVMAPIWSMIESVVRGWPALIKRE